MNNTAIDRNLSKLFNYRLITVIGAIILPLMALKILPATDIDPIIILLILGTGFIIGTFILRESTESSLIPYLILQLIPIWVLFDFTFLDSLNSSLKLYTMAFGLAFILSVYYVFSYFKYLWTCFKPFRYLFLFFLANIFYLCFYYSDFRNSPYPDIWFAKQNEMLFQSSSFTLKNFRDNSGFVIYLISLSPLVSFVVSSMVFHGLNTINGINNRLITIIRIITYGFLIYFLAALLSILLGISNFAFEDGRLTGNFFGASFGFHIFLSLFLILFIGFKQYLQKCDSFKGKNLMIITLNIIMFASLLLVLMHINKTSILGLIAGFLIITVINFKPAIKDLSERYKTCNKNPLTKLVQLLPLLIILGVILENSDFVGLTLSNITDRFSNISTLDSRTVIWQNFFANWLDNLTLFKVLFGFGIDSSVESVFFISSMFPRSDILLSTHNIYISMFYDYGLIAFLYFGAIFSIVINNLKQISQKNSDSNIRLFSSVSLAICTFFLIYHFTDGLRIPIAILFFCMIGLLESIKYAFKNAIEL